MHPKQQIQQQQQQQQQQPQHAAGRPPGGSSSAGGRPSGSKPSSDGRPGGGMNYFAALAGFSDADALTEEIAADEDQRRSAATAAAASSNGGSGAAANGRPGSGGSNSNSSGGLKQPLVWIDLANTHNLRGSTSVGKQTPIREMTGLDVETDSILQIAVICTDGTLEEVVEGPELCVHQPEEVLAGMNAWCVEQHGKSGLTQACRDSTTSLAEAEQQVLEFVQQHAPEPSTAQIAGNSVHVDLAFLRKHMPRLVEHLHYRIVDVSTVGELCRRWFPREHMRAPKKRNTHTALSDIRESIQQLQYYRCNIFKKWAGSGLP